MSNTVLDLIGNTPLVKAQNLVSNPRVELYFKLEGQNPGGSVKDRPAYNMIKKAMERGDITKDTKLIEATSGNTGIALAMVARLLNLDIELVMPENSTVERVQTMRAYGAKVILTDADVGIEGARDYAEERMKNGNYFMLNQFGNDDNWQAHYHSTGPEIWNDTHQKITHFVSSMGTTGTIMGTSTFLKEKNKGIKIVGVQPADEARIPGIRKWPEAYLPRIFDPKKVDRIMEVTEEEARAMTMRLAEEEAIFAGMSSGGAAAAAVRLCEELEDGVVVSIVCDRGDRYLSSNLFEK
ncbi:cysteine synthase B [Salinimicrobium sediminis]|uniref:Cysteine synthase n=1 Tax=Salinimicrobium sediminis TaxID=1343891 RepID=A0A285X442_9FLAO|nr:cysteine synthase CysM [Salinimicrobium sediminis]MDX1752971.1 cysteine synthase CysM [Salinimicrobium sediminis]SOC80113.1 cysteine synthase B [Salinimicrobium sediminis]